MNTVDQCALSVLIPSYREGEALAKLLPDLKIALNELNIIYEVLIVDTMRQLDDTNSICEANQVTYLNREGGDYYGDAIRTGIKAAHGDRILVMDADGSHNPKYIKDIWNNKDRAEIIIGSRYINGGKTENNFILIFMSYCVNIIFRYVLNLKEKDISNSFRLYPAKKIKTLTLHSDNFDIVEELLVKLVSSSLKCTTFEVPVTFEKRKAGESKRNLFAFALSYILTLFRLLSYKFIG